MTEITPTLEDYLKTIYRIHQEKGVCRVKDIAEVLEIKPPSVNNALGNLCKRKLVVHEKYGLVELTPKGRRIGRDVFVRHTAVEQFFHSVLGLDILVARADACKIEHYLSPETIDRIFKFVNFIERCTEETPLCLSRFHRFVQEGGCPPGRCGKESHADAGTDRDA